jgi:hypothetical protein
MYMVHCLGEKLGSMAGSGKYPNVIEIFEYDVNHYIVGRRYTAVDGQGLTDVSIYRSLEAARRKAREMRHDCVDQGGP